MFDVKYLMSQAADGDETAEDLWKSYCGDKKIPINAEDKNKTQALALTAKPLASETELVKYATQNSFSLLPLAKVIGKLHGDKLQKVHQEFNSTKVQSTKYLLISQQFDELTSYKPCFDEHAAPELTENGESLLIQYIFRALFNFRERKS